MTRRFTKVVLSILLAYCVIQTSACGSGGSDMPFVFDDGSSGAPSGSTNPPPTVGCSTNTDCTAPQTCDTSTHTCKSPPAGGCTPACSTSHICDTATSTCRAVTCSDDPTICNSATQKCESGLCVCDSTKTTCGASTGACEVLFDAALTLKVDDSKTAMGHYDSPSTCCEYGGPNGTANCPGSAPTGAMMTSPSENTDLYCCAPGQTGPVLGHPELFCDPEWRHEPVPEVAATRWSAVTGDRKVHMKFDLSGGRCRVWLLRDDFPEYHLDGSALDASIAIDAGKNYPIFPGSLPQTLNEEEIEGVCEKSTDASGNVQVNITSIPLRFAVQLYSSYTQCAVGVKSDTPPDPASCPPSFTPDTLYYPTDNPITPDIDERRQSYQIIPGFDRGALTLTTGGPQTQPPVDPARQTAMAIIGSPLHYDPAGGGATRMSLVAAFDMPDGGISTTRNDHTGVGQLHAQLNKAILTAEIIGTVTKLDGSPIQTEADLTTDCGTGGGPQRLEIGVHSTFNTTSEDLTITGDPTKPTEPFTTEACVPGTHVSGNCQFLAASNLPFAKDAGAGDPLVGTEAKFIKEGTLLVQNKGASNVSITLAVPGRAGAFEVLNSLALQNITLAPGNSTTLNIRFEPETNASGCTTTAGVVNCQASLSLSSDHSVTVTLKGQAKPPAAEVHLEEIASVAPNAAVATILPTVTPTPIDFGETLLGIQTKTRLYQLSNTGVRNLVVNDIQAQDVKRNFRMGSIYQGTDFQHREWRVGSSPWTVSAVGNNSMFFFLNYGPFGRVVAGDTRIDTGTLVINAVSGVQSVSLTGIAKKDSRATVSIYIEDSTRGAPPVGTTDPDYRAVTEGGATKHLYRAKNKLFSFRQDPATRVAYLFNDGAAPGIDELLIQRIVFTSAPGFVFTPNAADPRVATCQDALESATSACATLTVAGGPNMKLGTITFTPLAGSYSVSSASMVVKAISRPVSAAEGVPPIIGGNPTTTNDNPIVAFALKGASGAPGGADDLDLRVHRLMAGFSGRVNVGLQRSLIVSTATKGIVSRIDDPDYSANTWKEVYTIPNGINLNPVTGVATLTRMVIPVDRDMNDPAEPGTLQGLRLFNSPGSISSHQEGGDAKKAEYFAQCGGAASHSCAFFYLYIGDWAGSTTPMPSSDPTPAACQGKYPVRPSYNGATPVEMSTQFNTVLKPDDPIQYGCLTGADGIKDEANGIYDPVTGRIAFNDLAVRLYSPRVPEIGNNDIDATLRVSLTTGCVIQDEVPDPAAQPQYLVPAQSVLEDSDSTPGTDFSTVVMPASPLEPYVDRAGTTCATRELHGRPMFETGINAMTDTLDNDSDSDALNFGGFDMAGVGRNTTSSTSVNAANMYIIIKAEILP